MVTPEVLEERKKELKGFRRRGGTEWKELGMKMLWELELERLFLDLEVRSDDGEED